MSHFFLMEVRRSATYAEQRSRFLPHFKFFSYRFTWLIQKTAFVLVIR
jgi:hypothetical protein